MNHRVLRLIRVIRPVAGVRMIAVVRLIAVVLALTSSAAAQRMEGDLPQPISTSELERMMTRALLAPPAPPSLDPLHPDNRKIFAAIEPLHDAYLAEVLALRDRELTERLRMAPRLRDGGSLSEVERHRRQLAILHARAVEAESQLFAAIAGRLPEAQRPRVESMHRERVRRRHGDRSRHFGGIISLDVIELVEAAGLQPEERSLLEPVLTEYEVSLVRMGPRYIDLVERSQMRYLAFLRMRETEFLAAFQGDPPDHERARSIRLDAWRESGRSVPLEDAIVRLKDLHRRTLRRVLAALPVESRFAVIRAARSGFSLDEYPPIVAAAERVTHRLLMSEAVSSDEHSAVAALRAEWLGRDIASALDRMDLFEVLNEIQNPLWGTNMDLEAAESTRAEIAAIDEMRTKRARHLMTTVVSMIGRTRAEAIGVILPSAGSLAEGIEWIDPAELELLREVNADESAVTVRETIARTQRAEMARQLAAPPPMELAALRQQFTLWQSEVGVMEAIDDEHRRYEAAWNARVEPALAEVAIEMEHLHQVRRAGEGTGSADFDAVIEAISIATDAQRRALAAAWSVETALFAALLQRIGSEDRAPIITAVQSTRLWQMGGGVRERPGLLSEWGQPVEVDIAAWALDSSIAPPARSHLQERLHADHRTFETLLRDRAERGIDYAEQGARHNAVGLLKIEDERFEEMAGQFWSEARPVNEANSNAIAQLVRFTRDALDAAALELEGEERAAFRASVYAAIYPGLCRDTDSPVELFERLLNNDALATGERAVVERIARMHAAAHAVATEGMIAAAVAIDAMDPELPDSERQELQERRLHEVARWRFERSEANAKARMHLRNELSRETLERIPSLSAEWLREPS